MTTPVLKFSRGLWGLKNYEVLSWRLLLVKMSFSSFTNTLKFNPLLKNTISLLIRSLGAEYLILLCGDDFQGTFRLVIVCTKLNLMCKNFNLIPKKGKAPWINLPLNLCPIKLDDLLNKKTKQNKTESCLEMTKWFIAFFRSVFIIAKKIKTT